MHNTSLGKGGNSKILRIRNSCRIGIFSHECGILEKRCLQVAASFCRFRLGTATLTSFLPSSRVGYRIQKGFGQIRRRYRNIPEAGYISDLWSLLCTCSVVSLSSPLSPQASAMFSECFVLWSPWSLCTQIRATLVCASAGAFGVLASPPPLTSFQFTLMLICLSSCSIWSHSWKYFVHVFLQGCGYPHSASDESCLWQQIMVIMVIVIRCVFCSPQKLDEQLKIIMSSLPYEQEGQVVLPLLASLCLQSPEILTQRRNHTTIAVPGLSICPVQGFEASSLAESCLCLTKCSKKHLRRGWRRKNMSILSLNMTSMVLDCLGSSYGMSVCLSISWSCWDFLEEYFLEMLLFALGFCKVPKLHPASTSRRATSDWKSTFRNQQEQWLHYCHRCIDIAL